MNRSDSDDFYFRAAKLRSKIEEMENTSTNSKTINSATQALTNITIDGQRRDSDNDDDETTNIAISIETDNKYQIQKLANENTEYKIKCEKLITKLRDRDKCIGEMKDDCSRITQLLDDSNKENDGLK